MEPRSPNHRVAHGAGTVSIATRAAPWCSGGDTAPVDAERAEYDRDLDAVPCFEWTGGSCTMREALHVIEACHRNCGRGAPRVLEVPLADVARGPVGHDTHWSGPAQFAQNVVVRWPEDSPANGPGEASGRLLAAMIRRHMCEHAPEFARASLRPATRRRAECSTADAGAIECSEIERAGARKMLAKKGYVVNPRGQS